jgi:hypothetical protein
MIGFDEKEMRLKIDTELERAEELTIPLAVTHQLSSTLSMNHPFPRLSRFSCGAIHDAKHTL